MDLIDHEQCGPATGSHRPPEPRRTFTAGQRALLWAAGVLGTLAIIIAVMLVAFNKNQPGTSGTEQTVTEKVSPPSSESHPDSTPAHPTGWTRTGTSP